ncbi:Holliday junction resolvase RuvX [Candidatus Nanopelagicales bacterium]|nr:Holliday junction resolvase RuvX [Candidatus Nanopelagicales bacterium]
MRPGVALGLDHGSVRIGVARSDPDGLLAVPVETVQAQDTPHQRISQIIAEYDATRIYVGDPISLKGEVGPAAQAARSFAHRIQRDHPALPVRMVDERLSTVGSQRGMHQAGRNTRKSRSVIDQAAAVTILQGALDAQRNSGGLAGTPLDRSGDDK